MNYLPDEQRETAKKQQSENKGTKNEMAETEKRMSMYAQGQVQGKGNGGNTDNKDRQRTRMNERTKAEGNFLCGFIIKRTK